MTSLGFSPDGRRIASAASDRKTLVWDAATGAVERTIDPSFTVGTAPTGRLAAVGAGRLRIWDAFDRPQPVQAHTGSSHPGQNCGGSV